MYQLDYTKYLRTRSNWALIYRKYWLYPRIVRYLATPILDVGCGIGDFLHYQSGTVGVDINAENIAHCRKRNLDAVPMENDILPFKDEEFQSIVLDNVIEHLASPNLLLTEISRVARPNATLVVGIPGIRGYAMDNDHKTFYDEDALEKTLLSVGFMKSHVFYMPLGKSRFLSRYLRAYCIYVVFRLIDTQDPSKLPHGYS